MSWHYLLELEGESLEDICSGGELLQPLKSKITHAEFYCKGKLMDSYLDSLSGTTFVLSMGNLGEEKSVLSQEVFHAKIFLPQEKAQDLTEKGRDSGEKWQGSFTKYSPDSCSWKTHQCSLAGDLDEFSETWPRWGSMRTGECYQLPMLEQNINETEYGLWPTPTTPSGGGNCGGSGAYKNAIKNGTHIPHSINPSLYEWLMGWPIGWTDLKPLVTGKSPCVQLPHGES